MKKYLLLSLLSLVVISVTPVMSQKVTVNIKRSKESSLAFWRILNDNSSEVISASGRTNGDSVTFSLEADRHYSLWIASRDTNMNLMLNYTLGINGEDILRVTGPSSACGKEYKFFTGIIKPVSKIIGGTNASIADFPWQVYYISGNYLCGGTIIDKNWVVTAAHCTKDNAGNPISASSMSIRVGSGTTSGGKTYNVSSYIVHSAFNSQSRNNDIALLRIDGPINYTNATPIKIVSAYDIADGAIDPGVISWVSGWGLVKTSPQTLPANLQKVQLPIVSDEEAATVWGPIPETDIMAGYLNGTRDACNGDSGGPLVVPVTGEYKLAGIVSWGNISCNTYGGYTRASDFAEWIADKTGILDLRPVIPAGNKMICNTNDTAFYNVAPFQSGTNYEWKLFPDYSGSILGNSTNAKVAWNNFFEGQAQVMVRTKVNGSMTDWSKLKVLVAPKINILASSKDTALCVNLPVTLVANAAGFNLSYKWYKDNTPFQSANSNFISFASVNLTNSGIYRCDVSDECSTVSSANMKLTVMPHTSITDLTPDADVPFGTNATLEVSSEGQDLSYHWQKDGVLLADAISPVLPLFDVNTKDIGQYRVTVKGTCGSVTSDSIYVYVNREETSDPVDVFEWPTIASNEFNIAINNDDVYTIQLFSSKGILIKEMKKCRYLTHLYAGALPPGNYFLNVFNAKFRKLIKVIKV